MGLARSCAQPRDHRDRDDGLPAACEGFGHVYEATREGRELRLLQKSGA